MLYLNIHILYYQTATQNILHRMTTSISWLQSDLNFFLNRILNCYGCFLFLFPNIWNAPPFERDFYQCLYSDFVQIGTPYTNCVRPHRQLIAHYKHQRTNTVYCHSRSALPCQRRAISLRLPLTIRTPWNSSTVSWKDTSTHSRTHAHTHTHTQLTLPPQARHNVSSFLLWPTNATRTAQSSVVSLGLQQTAASKIFPVAHRWTALHITSTSALASSQQRYCLFLQVIVLNLDPQTSDL